MDVTRFNRTLIWSLSSFGAALLLAVLIQVRYGLQPLRRIRSELEAIRIGRSKKLDENFPPEIMPLVEELNALLEHNAEIVERARTHVGNLAHALKTPLSVLANEANENAGPKSGVVAKQTATMRRHVEHYLARARAAATGELLGAHTPIDPVISDLCRTLQKIHAEKNISMDCDTISGLVFRGEKQDLEEMLGNLLDNAFKWCSEKVSVYASANGEGRLKIKVSDDGPGVAMEQREQVFDRGNRYDESVPGSGLGLAIVRDLAALYGGDVSLGESTLGGLEVTLSLPSAPTV